MTAPTSGSGLPVILVSHGGGTANYLPSLRGLSPLVDFWAAHGFVVIQPTHLSAKSLGLPRLAPNSEAFWKSRVDDLICILDDLAGIETQVPGLQSRLDPDRVAVAGHSMGAQTAHLLLGSHFTDDNGSLVRVADDRVKAGVLMSSTGSGDHITELGAQFTCLRTAGFDQMTTPALVIAGDRDDSAPLSTAGPSYHADPYKLAPGPKSLVTIVDGEHQLGGVTGYDASETTDEDPERVAIVQRLTCAYLQSVLTAKENLWNDVTERFAALPDLGTITNK